MTHPKTETKIENTCDNETRRRGKPSVALFSSGVVGTLRECASYERKQVGADGGGRTHTLLRVPDFESSASANSATSARAPERRFRSGPTIGHGAPAVNSSVKASKKTKIFNKSFVESTCPQMPLPPRWPRRDMVWVSALLASLRFRKNGMNGAGIWTRIVRKFASAGRPGWAGTAINEVRI